MGDGLKQLPAGTIVSSFNSNIPGFLKCTGGDFLASMYPNLASVLVGSNDLLNQIVYLPNLGSFTETINYSYKGVSEKTIGYTLSNYITAMPYILEMITLGTTSVDWDQYWDGTILGNLKYGKALAYALDEAYYIIDTEGKRITDDPENHIFTSNNVGGTSAPPYWSMPDNTKYIAPLYINSITGITVITQENTPTEVTETIEQGEIDKSATITGYYWIAY